MASKKSCFIIMPISTPEDLPDAYGGDEDHFEHVLEQLFVPAVKAAGVEPIPPTSEGSGVIHGDIIKNIETAEMLLCDMSILNANVFFELGMRTAANKPVALVKDDVTPKVPFDLGIINHYTYKAGLKIWEIEREREELKSHLEKCVEKIDDGNPLWKHFSVSAKAVPLEAGADVEGQLAFMNRQIEDVREAVKSMGKAEESKFFRGLVGHRLKLSLDEAGKDEEITAAVSELARNLGIQVDGVEQTPDEVADEKACYDLHDNQPGDPGYRRFLDRLFTPLNQRLAPNSLGLDFGCGPGPALAPRPTAYRFSWKS